MMTVNITLDTTMTPISLNSTLTYEEDDDDYVNTTAPQHLSDLVAPAAENKVQQWQDSGEGSDNTGDYSYDWAVNVDFQPHIVSELVYVSAAVLGSFGLVGNALLFCLSLQPDLRKFSYSMYLSAVSVVDSISLVSACITLVLQTRGSTSFDHVDTLPACVAVLMVTQIAASMSPWIMVVFALDRYVAIVFPLKRKVFCTVRNTRIICALVFVVSLILALPSAIGARFVDYVDRHVCVQENEGIATWIITYMFLNKTLPCLLLLYLNTHSLTAVQLGLKKRMSMTRGAKRADPGDSSTHVASRSRPQRPVPEDRPARHHMETAADSRQRMFQSKMFRALLALPSYTFVAFSPAMFTDCTLAILQHFPELIFETSATAVTGAILDAQFYTRIFYASSFASNFYLFIGTSKSFRLIACKMLRCWSSSNSP